MRRIRVLVINEVGTARRAVSAALMRDPDIEAIAGPTPTVAMQKVVQVAPDAVVVDIGAGTFAELEIVRQLHAERPALPLIVCVQGGAAAVRTAQAAGATMTLVKPSDGHASGPGAARFDAELIEAVQRCALPRPVRVPAPAPVWTGSSLVTAITIGCSTGGPKALGVVFKTLPGDLPAPIFIVQHMPPVFTRQLAEHLTAGSEVHVVEAEEGMLAEAGRAYIAPGDFHMTVARDAGIARLHLNQGPRECSCRPSVDVLFRSVAAAYGAGVQGAVLTGMGVDGSRGARAIVDAGGRMLVQDSASCVVPSMPEGLAAAGVPAEVVPLAQLGHELELRARRGHPPRMFSRRA